MKKLYTDCITKFCLGVGKESLISYLSKRLEDTQKLWGDKPWQVEVYERYLLDTVVPHKIAVYEAGMELSERILKYRSDIVLQHWEKLLLLHDLSKFSVHETAYAYYFDKSVDRTHSIENDFTLAWHHHKMNNPHHPEYWWDVDRSGKTKPLPMPYIYIVEMLADWIGAGKVYGNPLDKWLLDNIELFRFHADTTEYLKGILRKYFDFPVICAIGVEDKIGTLYWND